MFEKLAKFPIARSRRGAPGMIVPANDNRPRARRNELRRGRPQLACRWFVDEAGRLGSRWETEAPEDPGPSRRDRSIAPFFTELSSIRLIGQGTSDPHRTRSSPDRFARCG